LGFEGAVVYLNNGSVGKMIGLKLNFGKLLIKEGCLKKQPSFLI